MEAHSFHVHFCVVFQNFYAILLRTFCTLINTSISKILAAGRERTTIGYTSATLRYPPLTASL